VTLEVQPPVVIQARDECYSNFPVFNPDAGGWVKGVRLRGVIAEECAGTGLVIPESVKVKIGTGAAAPFALCTDYQLDPLWGSIGRIQGGAIGHRQTVWIDYDYKLSRIDTVFADGSNNLHVTMGAPAVALALPPQPLPGETALINIYVRGGAAQLAPDSLYPIDFAFKPAPPAPVAETLLPKTLAKLRAGQPVTVVSWGDSVTDGGGVKEQKDWYQNQFVARLHERFPNAPIRLLNAGWGGASSKGYLEAPAGGTYDFVRDVLDPKPDMVTMEFVNDASLDEAGVAAHYAGILEKIRATGAELVLITPHLVRPDWLKVNDTLFTEDPRPYVKGLKQFAAANNVALADGSARYLQLRPQGIPYQTILANDINHPDARGHKLFADALMDLFPAQ
jgi:lysophospholipase L1-like esterase